MHLIPAYFARTRPLLLAACLFFLSKLLASAALPPSNDQCSGAEEIPGGGPFPFLTLQRVIDGAGTVGDPPLPPPHFATNITRSVWYKFTPTVSGLYTFSTALDTDTNFRDTTMVMYTTGGADCANFTIYAYNEDSGTLRSAISTNLTADTTYYIVVWAGGTEVITEGMELQVRVTKPAVPSNDTCANPIIIPSSISAPYLTALVDTTLSTTAAIAPPPCVTNVGTMPSREVWYQFTPAATATYIFSTGSDTATRIEDTSIELYTLGAGGCNSPNQIACNDNSYGRAVLSTTLSLGVTYHLAVYDNARNYIPGETDLQLRVAPATAPTVVTLPASSITSTGVALNGTINANGLLSRFWFEWGSTPSLGSTSAVKVLFATASTFVTNVFVSGFQPGTTYHYRMVGTNNLGRGEGAVLSFAFSNAPPPRITTYGYELSRAFLMEFDATASHLYVIQGSTNLFDWLDLGVATEGSPAHFNFRHSSPEPQRFYRIRQP
jgi:hypothetical protein